MLREIEDRPAVCWVEGEPTENGFYFTRWEACGNYWIYIYECKHDGDLGEFSRNKMLYFDHRGGNYLCDHALRMNGRLTHHCKVSSKNLEEILQTLSDHRFDSYKYVRQQ